MADFSPSLGLPPQEQTPLESTARSSPQQPSISQPATPPLDPSFVFNEEQQLYDVGTAMLCAYCLGILTLLREQEPWSESKYSERRYKHGWQFPHYYSVNDLQQSAERGCYLCIQLSSPHADYARGFPQPGKGCLKIGGDNSWEIVLTLTMQAKPKTSYRSCDIGKVQEHSIYPASRHNDTSQNSKNALPLAIAWLQDCRQRHKLCHPSSRLHSRILPTRLLDLRNNHVKLVSGINLDKSTEYATLSHCWGNIPFINLKRAFITQYFTEIFYKDLPQTFKDAVYIARFAGLNYLWIDSLCIIQDDDDDWKRESARMASVYGNSALTIAASGALNSSVGCFFDRIPSWRCQLTTTPKDKEQIYECTPWRLRADTVFENQPLFHRGWAVQERILSPRILHFTSTQLIWECKQTRECEGGFASDSLYGARPQDFKPPLDLKDWELIVRSYSSSKLTYGKDKLVALSGLAQASRLGDCQRYYAGLWENNIEEQLLWFTQEGSRSLSYRAPSWSWASLDGTIYFHHTYFSRPSRISLYVKAHKVTVQLVRQEEPYGEVQSATIKLLCKYLLPNNIIDCLTFTTNDWGGGSDNIDWYFDDKLEMNGINYQDCFLLPILQSRENSTNEITCLILHPTKALRGQYTRVGRMAQSPQNRRSDFEEFVRSNYSQAKPEHCLDISLDTIEDGHQFAGMIELV